MFMFIAVVQENNLFIYLILKSYPKYKMDRDIADNADKNRKKPAESTQGTCNILFTRHIY